MSYVNQVTTGILTTGYNQRNFPVPDLATNETALAIILTPCEAICDNWNVW